MVKRGNIVAAHGTRRCRGALKKSKRRWKRQKTMCALYFGARFTHTHKTAAFPSCYFFPFGAHNETRVRTRRRYKE